MTSLKDRLTIIEANKTEELKKIDDSKIEYAILEQEIEDVKYCLEALKIEDKDKQDSILSSAQNSTTSNSLYNALSEYMKMKKE